MKRKWIRQAGEYDLCCNGQNGASEANNLGAVKEVGV